MNIGHVTPSPSGELVGHLAIMSFDARIGFKPVASANERSPKFEIMALNVARRWVRLGALWEKEASQTGEVYLTGHIDDPVLPAKLYVAAFRQNDDAYAIVWTRAAPSARPDGPTEAGAALVAEPAGEDDEPDSARARRRRIPAAATDDPFA